MTLKQTLDEFINTRVMFGLVEKSIVDYKEFCSRFVLKIGSEKDYQNLCQSDITDYILDLMNMPLSKNTIATYIRHLKVYLKWCTENYKDTNFDYKKIKVPKSPKKNVMVYSDDDIRQMFQSVDADAEWIVIRYCAIVALMLDSGLRQAEITRIICMDIDFRRKTLNVHGKGDKDRVVPLGQISSSYIKKYTALCPVKFDNKDILFITRELNPITTNAVKLMVNYCLDQYHKYGQIDIYQLMYLLGHEDVKTTSRYLHFAYEIIATENTISHVDSVFMA